MQEKRLCSPVAEAYLGSDAPTVVGMCAVVFTVCPADAGSERARGGLGGCWAGTSPTVMRCNAWKKREEKGAGGKAEEREGARERDGETEKQIRRCLGSGRTADACAVNQTRRCWPFRYQRVRNGAWQRAYGTVVGKQGTWGRGTHWKSPMGSISYLSAGQKDPALAASKTRER